SSKAGVTGWISRIRIRSALIRAALAEQVDHRRHVDRSAAGDVVVEQGQASTGIRLTGIVDTSIESIQVRGDALQGRRRGTNRATDRAARRNAKSRRRIRNRSALSRSEYRDRTIPVEAAGFGVVHSARNVLGQVARIVSRTVIGPRTAR